MILSAGAVCAGIVTAATLWIAGPAAASFSTGATVSTSYSTALLAPPSGLAATVSGPSVQLEWSPAASPPAGGTTLLRAASSSGPYTAVASLAAGTSSYTDTPGPGTWSYEAESSAGAWTSPPTGPVTATVKAVPSYAGQVASGATTTWGSTLTLNLSAGVPAGDLLVVRTAIAGTGTITSVTDAAGNSYIPEAAVSEASDLTSEMWAATLSRPLPAGQPVTVSWSGSVGSRVAVADAFTAAGTGADGTATASGRGTAPAVTSATVAGDLEVALTGVDAPASDTYTEAAGWSPLGSVSQPGPGQKKGLSLYGAWRLAPSTSDSHDPTLASAAYWAECDVALPPG